MVWHNVAMRTVSICADCYSFRNGGAQPTEPAPFILVDQFDHLPKLEKRAVSRNPIVGFDAAARSFHRGRHTQ